MSRSVGPGDLPPKVGEASAAAPPAKKEGALLGVADDMRSHIVSFLDPRDLEQHSNLLLVSKAANKAFQEPIRAQALALRESMKNYEEALAEDEKGLMQWLDAEDKTTPFQHLKIENKRFTYVVRFIVRDAIDKRDFQKLEKLLKFPQTAAIINEILESNPRRYSNIIAA